ncbi:MAG: TraB/VirB10 family protein [Rickettsiaceae bacterium]|nr:TraB/VirB10 family protein [Rickettsiaceae bacterium]
MPMNMMTIMNKIVERIKNITRYIICSTRSFFEITSGKTSSSSDNLLDDSSSIYRNQIFKLFLAVLALAGFLYIFFSLSLTSNARESSGKSRSSNSSNASGKPSSSREKNKTIKVEVASKSLDPDLMWRSYFEERLDSEQENSNKKLGLLAESVHMLQEEQNKKTTNEIESLKRELLSAKNELSEAILQMRELSSTILARSDSNIASETSYDISSVYIEDEINISAPKDAKSYIPETSYVEAALLGGIAVSTSIGSQSEPVPVIMRVVGSGNLPKNFSLDLTKCRILGSSYGDLSSERAIIRAETLVCSNDLTGEVITTKIAGQIYGDDGMNGIKGRIVDMSTKNIKNAAIGGMLSGFASTLKQNSGFSVTSMGAISTDKQSLNERAKDNMLTGAGTAAEKIADYYIKQAENMSPVLLIPGGTRVDIAFTKGVYLGSSSVVAEINKERKSNGK